MSNDNNITELPDPAQIEQEAGEWIIKLDGDIDLSPAEHQAFKAWMGRSPAHRAAVKELAKFWGKMNILTELGMPRYTTKPQTAAPQPAWRWRYATAFSLLMLVSVVFWQWGGSTNSNGLYATAVGQQSTIQLSDGSELQLNTNSQIKINYSAGYRDIQLLQGEAHFTVAKNRQRPFRVTAGHGVVQAIGTAFSVYLNRDKLEVVMTEGKVGLQSRPMGAAALANNQTATAITADHNLGQLTAGQSAVIKSAVIKSAENQYSTNNPGSQQPVTAIIESITEQELARRLSWRKGYVIFKGAPLSQVVKEVGRYSQLNIELGSPDMAAIKIGGQFRVGEVDALLESLEKNFGLAVKHLSYNHVQLSKQTANK